MLIEEEIAVGDHTVTQTGHWEALCYGITGLDGVFIENYRPERVHGEYGAAGHGEKCRLELVWVPA